jgi:cell division protein FtsW
LFGALFLSGLVCVPGIGRAVGGAQRWFRLGPLSFQPSEALKLIWVVFLADSLSRRQNRLCDIKGVMPYVVLLVASGGLLQMQHDFGSAVMLCVVTAVMLFLAGVRVSYLVGPGLFLMSGLVMLVVLTPYRMRRISAFLHPWDDPLGSGFQLIQSLIAVGSGGPLGVGLSNSTQKLFYLPAPHTDFIFAIISEELGLWGSCGVVLLFALFAFRGLKVAGAAHMKRDGLFEGLLASGLTGLIAFQALLNLGVVTGMLPTKGLPLPLVSYGGTSLVFTLVAVGLLLNVSRGTKIHGDAIGN